MGALAKRGERAPPAAASVNRAPEPETSAGAGDRRDGSERALPVTQKPAARARAQLPCSAASPVLVTPLPCYKLWVRSMTGYGRGRAELGGVHAEVELQSVNHRFLDLKVRPGGLEPAVQERVATAVRNRVARGSVTVNVRMRRGPDAEGIRVDVEAGKRVYAELDRLARALGTQPASLELVCAQPGVVCPAESEKDDESLAACAEQAAQAAGDALVAMREAEGAALERDVTARAERMSALVLRLEESAQAAPAGAARRLDQRIGRLLQASTAEIDDARLAQEVALVADRIDVTEELVRARTHLEHLRDAMASAGEPVGRRLDFLAQELGREINTVASKSQSTAISTAVVEFKAELEKLREQVQNVE